MNLKENILPIFLFLLINPGSRCIVLKFVYTFD